ncbi:MAG: 4'-phosphopantetheinyl transferase superfamily protein [Deltaproteobacteria bacterium]|nr:4'-phosphopantetheinyl transferase superfamily protein [Deltaproteobacteria bacterium]
MGLGRAEVALFLAYPASARERGLLPAYAELLGAGERDELVRYGLERDRVLHLVSWALARTVLSRLVPGVAPAAWRFAAGPYGRPEIAAPEPPAPLRFNLSHTRGLAACAVAVGRDVGVDVEQVRPRAYWAIAESFFAPAEVAALRAAPASELADRFFALWTLKEAYAKARGMGLTIGLDRFGFALGAPDGGDRIDIAAELGDEAGSWQFARLSPTAEHRLALAVRRGHDPPLAVRVQTVLPLGA